jgi:hypothetical protein
MEAFYRHKEGIQVEVCYDSLSRSHGREWIIKILNILASWLLEEFLYFRMKSLHDLFDAGKERPTPCYWQYGLLIKSRPSDPSDQA